MEDDSSAKTVNVDIRNLFNLNIINFPINERKIISIYKDKCHKTIFNKCKKIIKNKYLIFSKSGLLNKIGM